MKTLSLHLISFIFFIMMTTSNAQPQFPKLKVKTLTKQTITFPNDLTGEINILILVFEEQSQSLVDTWANIILSEYEPKENISYYEIPMMSGWYAPMAFQIDNWMRAGIPKQFHDNTACYYGNRDSYFKELGMTDKSSCYLFILDQRGKIVYRDEGRMTEEKERNFRQKINSLQQVE